jgi:hypothetical protein
MTMDGAVVLVLLAATGSLVAHLGLAVFNDGVRATARIAVATHGGRKATAKQAARLAGPSVFGFGAVMSVLSGLLNPFLLLLPTDAIGLRSTRRWLAVVLGACWGAAAVAAVLGLHRALESVDHSPMPYLGTLADALVLMLPFFPAIAAAEQLGRLRGAAVLGVVVAATVVVARTGGTGAWMWLPLILGVALYLVLLVPTFRQAHREQGPRAGASPFAELQAANSARLRRALPLLMVLGALTGAACHLQVYGGSEVSLFLLADGDVGGAAMLDGFRALGYLPLIVMVAMASGTYGAAGLTLVYPVGYLSPNLATAAVLGALVIALEVCLLRRANDVAIRYPCIRTTTDHLRNALYTTLELGLSGGCLLIAAQSLGAVGFALVGGLFMANEALGRPVIRMAAAPSALLITVVLLNLIPPEAFVSMLGRS